MPKPTPTAGLHHVALYIKNLTECVHFYTALLGMRIIWQPDADNYYLTSGSDNLALHRAPRDFDTDQQKRLDHIGFFLTAPEQVDEWHTYLKEHDIAILAAPKNHRDGTRSFYCADPDGNAVQLIYYPLL
ncbi:MAG: glyoxalase [Gammaproteobacteria bacterium RIFCSPHIGHO2_12_FULL_45_12]|nr:MAG: glyoxalase [Gammaproteobacteria bacterium RIFCSPHIGHO2_12_FULL_45_12]